MKRLSGDFDDVAQRWSVLRVREQVTTGFGGGNAAIREEIVLEVGTDFNFELLTFFGKDIQDTSVTSAQLLQTCAVASQSYRKPRMYLPGLRCACGKAEQSELSVGN